ncbi:hypothetical protein AMIS_46700 [Actinoplanes missouriensis 431]|uniref:DUF6993 domain-containing protein n=1 Tax=Actinoplanes missouriensis (strain ATCC 14538 / DSM 43046 / CBS 188.64 / JCM 3121 / NBRC 102363 / NCIMB 12654 / NRRL B-3342 / UNCC 431) TaxID=512565 RepID=I0HA53_ACTM4|nr:hypothetical protein [Actinoplanes missouriensis]BAL89890.1 hypothetical protein AMIS_46700 [Actinoplanes missouriensis 431]
MRLIRFVPAVLFMAFAAACAEATADSSTTAKSPRWTTCADPANDDGHCDMERKDIHRRTVVPAIGEDEKLDEAAAAVHNVLGGTRLSATPEDVVTVREAFTTAGYADHLVRLARDTDPTVTGSLIYAVKVGDVCVMGDVTPSDRFHEWYAGVLPDGNCLAP